MPYSEVIVFPRRHPNKPLNCHRNTNFHFSPSNLALSHPWFPPPLKTSTNSPHSSMLRRVSNFQVSKPPPPRIVEQVPEKICLHATGKAVGATEKTRRYLDLFLRDTTTPPLVKLKLSLGEWKMCSRRRDEWGRRMRKFVPLKKGEGKNLPLINDRWHRDYKRLPSFLEPWYLYL